MTLTAVMTYHYQLLLYKIVVHGDESAYTNVATVHTLFNLDDHRITTSKDDTGYTNKLNNDKSLPQKGNGQIFIVEIKTRIFVTIPLFTIDDFKM